MHCDQFSRRSVQKKNEVIANSTPTEIHLSPFQRSNFSVPKTENEFVYALVSLKDGKVTTFHVDETEEALSDALRTINSCEIRTIFEIVQPTDIGYAFLRLEFC